MNDYGHWAPHQEFDPVDYFGFVYKIVDIHGRYYFGQKRLFNKIRRKPLKGKKRVRLDTRESDWKTYTSSGTFKEKIEQYGKAGYTFHIVDLCESANDLNIREIEYIVAHGRDKLCMNEFVARGASYKKLKV